MKVSFIGSGNLATHLAKGLYEQDFEIIEIWSRNLKNAKSLAKKVSAKAIGEISDLSLEVDLIFISVPDDAIKAVSQSLKKSTALVVHNSGSSSSDLLKKHSRRGVFWPMQTFRKSRKVDWQGTPTFIYGENAKDLKVLKQIAKALKVKSKVLNNEERAAMHLAAVFANNYSNHMLHIAENLMQESGLDFKLLLPIIEKTFANLEKKKPSTRQTGPAVRGDEKTIKRQSALLKGNSRYQKLYKLISGSIREESDKNNTK